MPGFYVGSKKCDISKLNILNKKCVFDSTETKKLYFSRNTLNKFLDDKCFYFSEEFCVILDGVLLNKTDLFLKYNCKNVADLCIETYTKNGKEFFSEFRGVFSGCFYDISKDILLIYTNQTGTKPIYYYSINKDFFAGSEVRYLLEACRNNGMKLSFNESAAYQMLVFAFMIDNSTYVKEIKRLQAGQYIVVENKNVSVKRYHIFKKNKERYEGYTDDELVEEVDKAFKEAVKREYSKDKEYSLESFAEMSGGLDSRMSAWIAHELEKDLHIQLLEFGKSNYLDELIAKEIAYYWKDEILVKSLDDISFLMDIDDLTRMLGGLSLYAGSTGMYRLANSLNVERYGIAHSGDVGDAILGSFSRYNKKGDLVYPTGAYSEKLIDKLSNLIIQVEKTYDDKELYLLYTRGLQGACNTSQIWQNFTETASAFCDVDFFQTCIDIPPGRRAGHRIYKKWILSKYPEAAKFKWEKIDDIISESNIRINLWRIRRKIENKLKIRKGNPSFNMNPIGYWLSEDTSKKKRLEDYFKDNIQLLKDKASSEIVDDINWLFDNGEAFEKIMAITVLSSVKLYFGKDHC